VKIPFDILQDALQRAETGLDNPGFCLSCGEENDNCEPDARNYTCEYCGKPRVFGAAEILMLGAYE